MKNYYFIGIGGIGMSGLAFILTKRGQKVSGSDASINAQTKSLEKLGVKVHQNQVASNITSSIDYVVVSSAIPKSNPEYEAAIKLGIKVIRRSELLNMIIGESKSIAVTGTHGKTSTTSMISLIFEGAGLDPTAIIGAEVKRMGGNAKTGEGEYAIAEVCEYQKAFLDIYPYAAVITNIEEDHLDCYKDINDIVESFGKFCRQIDPNGFLVINGDDNNVVTAAKNYKGKIISYGLSETNTYFPTDISFSKGLSHYKTCISGKEIEVKLRVPGKHNILNSLAAIAVANEAKVNPEAIATGLKDFSGADRRFQTLGIKSGVTFIDDYAHHPTEIKTTLDGARVLFEGKRIITVFQPHQFSRTKLLMKEFADSFANTDILILPEIYAARDTAKDIATISSSQLAGLINNKNHKKIASFAADYNTAANQINEIATDGDIIILMGAGPVNQIFELVFEPRGAEKTA